MKDEIKKEMIKAIGSYNNSLVDSTAESCAKVALKYIEQVYQSRLSKVGGLPGDDVIDKIVNGSLCPNDQDHAEKVRLLKVYRTEAQKALAAKDEQIAELKRNLTLLVEIQTTKYHENNINNPNSQFPSGD